MERRNAIKKQASECSPERSTARRERLHKPRGIPKRVSHFPSSPSQKAAVVYYISRNGKLEHPHFIEIPLSSSGELFLRDIIERLDVLRGKGMASMYSWSSKKNYKNGYVWHDLSEDDLILPTNNNEYVLKGSELFNDSDSDSPMNNPESVIMQQHQPSSSSIDCSSSASSINGKETKSSHETGASPLHHLLPSSDHLPQSDNLANAATQTEETTAGRASTVNNTFIVPSSTDTLENLIRSNVSKMESFRIFEEEDAGIPTKARMKATNLIMQLISCGSIPIKNRHNFGIIPSYKPRFSSLKFPSPLSSSSTTMGEFECFTEPRRFSALNLDERKFSTACSSESYKPMESSCSHVKCIPLSIKHSVNEPLKSPRSSNYKLESRRISSKKTDSFREETVIKIEERLASGARVIIESKSPIEVESCSP